MSGEWTVRDVEGHPCDIYEPSQRHEQGYVLIYLHGVHEGRLSEHPVFAEQFERWGLVVVGPRTRRSWWTDRICEEFDSTKTAEQYVRQDILAFIERQWNVQPPKIGIWGTSMGGQGALRLAYKHPRLFPVVAAISPAIDFQNRFDEGDETIPQMYPDPEAARQDTATLHIHPLNWPKHQFFCCDPSDDKWFESSDRLQMKLWSLGIPHEKDLESSHGGHGFQYYNQMAERTIEFLTERLEQERKRLY